MHLYKLFLSSGYVLSNPKEWVGKSFEVAADELTPLQV